MKKASDKILERVRKLLNMAKDAGSPNEAAIAASRARKLMDEYQLNEADIGKDGKTAHQFATEHCETSKPKWKNWLACAVADYNECVARGSKYGFVFQGLQEDAHMCSYMFDYLTTSADCQYSIFQSCQTGRARRAYQTVFLEGFSHEVCAKLRELGGQRTQGTGKDLIVLKKQLVEQKFGEANYRKGKGTSMDYLAVMAHEAGKEAGKRQSIHTGVGESSQERLR